MAKIPLSEIATLIQFISAAFGKKIKAKKFLKTLGFAERDFAALESAGIKIHEARVAGVGVTLTPDETRVYDMSDDLTLKLAGEARKLLPKLPEL